MHEDYPTLKRTGTPDVGQPSASDPEPNQSRAAFATRYFPGHYFSRHWAGLPLQPFADRRIDPG